MQKFNGNRKTYSIPITRIEKQSVTSWIYVYIIFIFRYFYHAFALKQFHIFMLDLTTFRSIFVLAQPWVCKHLPFAIKLGKKLDRREGEKNRSTLFLMILNWCNKRAAFLFIVLFAVHILTRRKCVKWINFTSIASKQNCVTGEWEWLSEWVNEWEYVAYFIHKLVYLCVMSIYHFSRKKKKKKKKK